MITLPPLDKAIAVVAPGWAAARALARVRLRAYEAANRTRLRKSKADNSSGNVVASKAAAGLRGTARHLDQNHDLVRGLLNSLVNGTVGPAGLSVEATPRGTDGEVLQDLARQLNALWKDWCRQPETTAQLDMAGVQRLMCRTWLRDGECLARHIEGRIPDLDHGTVVPYSLELLEPDHLPLDLDDPKTRLIQGVELSRWNRPTTYHLYQGHPGGDTDPGKPQPVPADQIVHCKLTDRIGQVRGVTALASVLNRLDDLKNYEESELVAARISAALAGYIKKGTAEMYEPGEQGERQFALAPGMIFDNLAPGEEVGTIESNRPSTLLEPFRNAMLRAVCSGTGANYSTVARDYSGTYSAQRQALVEAYINYQVLAAEFIAQFLRPVYRRFVAMALAAGVVKRPTGSEDRLLMDAEFRGQAMPWIDPKKEIDALRLAVKGGFKPLGQAIRERGGNPAEVMQQYELERRDQEDRGLVFDTVARHGKAVGNG